ncbi:ribonuclease HIII [Macrococcus brunensis]|uniref:Ribonuclease HIII n=1 Tax=Macrococcus brunensis TaxID=198483 RepID=A0A4R6BD23_9STAP|nr:ribonuclease HIII [Macrococcus brunensis]TDL96738.1 ribonuclease HIII [Macrococcus brunensis]ULG73573.1 ribonuclease HIII [Macrococcus brunensis]
MSTVVKVMEKNEIDKLLNKISYESTNLPPGMIARAKIQGHSLSVYRSNKVMIQGKDAENLAAELLGTVAPRQTDALQYDQFNCIGSDEAGSGDYFGPMTVVASYVSKKNAEILKILGVMDSKNLKDPKIVELAEQIIPLIPHSLLVLTNPKYNQQKALGWSQVKMKAVLHNQAIQNVLTKIEERPDYIVIDQFAVQGVYENYALIAIPERDRTRFETKGESKSIAIAASSIIARYAFIKWMDRIEEETGLDIYKGAGSKVDLQAAKIIQRKSLDYLDNITKKDFKNRTKALDLIERKRS